jgi:2-amino-4-hydroxy-6-hydroxymethyldihydropteridine diphosphokinase
LAEVWLALGSNLGDRRQHLRAALAALAARGVRVRRVSSLYETEPMYDLDQPAFLNAVVVADTQLAPEALLSAAKAVERQLGRQPRHRFGPREIDVDILLYEGQLRDTPELTIPHPRMAERPFVQAPLAELRGEPPGVWPGVASIEGPDWASA